MISNCGTSLGKLIYSVVVETRQVLVAVEIQLLNANFR